MKIGLNDTWGHLFNLLPRSRTIHNFGSSRLFLVDIKIRFAFLGRTSLARGRLLVVGPPMSFTSFSLNSLGPEKYMASLNLSELKVINSFN